MRRRTGTVVHVEALLDEFGIEAPEHIRVEDLAVALGVDIIEGDLGGCAAQLTVRAGRGRIRVPAEMQQQRRRFCIAHELGHFRLHKRQLRPCTKEDLVDWSGDSDLEREANKFAAELLMPTRMAEPICDTDEPGIVHVRKLADRFDASQTASAVRLTELTSVPCAVALIEDGRVRWVVRNSDFWLWTVPRGTHVDPQARAATAGSEPDGAWEVPGTAWIEDDRATRGVTLLEDAVRLGQRFVLSVISAPGLDPLD